MSRDAVLERRRIEEQLTASEQELEQLGRQRRVHTRLCLGALVAGLALLVRWPLPGVALIFTSVALYVVSSYLHWVYSKAAEAHIASAKDNLRRVQ
jgi:hypothetical protein